MRSLLPVAHFFIRHTPRFYRLPIFGGKRLFRSNREVCEDDVDFSHNQKLTLSFLSFVQKHFWKSNPWGNLVAHIVGNREAIPVSEGSLHMWRRPFLLWGPNPRQRSRKYSIQEKQTHSHQEVVPRGACHLHQR